MFDRSGIDPDSCEGYLELMVFFMNWVKFRMMEESMRPVKKKLFAEKKEKELPNQCYRIRRFIGCHFQV